MAFKKTIQKFPVQLPEAMRKRERAGRGGQHAKRADGLHNGLDDPTKTYLQVTQVTQAPTERFSVAETAHAHGMCIPSELLSYTVDSQAASSAISLPNVPGQCFIFQVVGLKWSFS
jgi:hypothetical protein